MARYELDELESDEVYHALADRKTGLETITKKLEEKDGLPEAAARVRDRIALYLPNGEGDDKRPGLLRLFAPQRDLDAELQQSHASEERDANGGADLFGGGAETGGGIPAGQTESIADSIDPKGKGKKGKKSKAGAAADVVAEADAKAAIDPVDAALDELSRLASELLGGEPKLDEETIYRGYAVPVLGLIPTINPSVDTEHLARQVNGELRLADDNGYALAYFIQRNVQQIRDIREKPIGRRDEAHDAPLSFAETDTE